MKFSLKVTGDKGIVEVLRGGFGGIKPGYTVISQAAGSKKPCVKNEPFSGLETELAEFIKRMKAYNNVNEILIFIAISQS